MHDFDLCVHQPQRLGYFVPSIGVGREQFAANAEDNGTMGIRTHENRAHNSKLKTSFYEDVLTSD